MDTTKTDSARPRMRRNIPFFWWAVEAARGRAAAEQPVTATVREAPTDAGGTSPTKAA